MEIQFINPFGKYVETSEILDDAVSLAKMASGTAGNLITYDAAGDPAAVSTGTAGQVLTSNGAGAAPTFQAIGAQLELLSSQEVTSGNYFEFSSLGENTQNEPLLLIFSGRGDTNTNQVLMTVNGLTTSTYDFDLHYAGSAAESNVSSSGASNFPLTQGTCDANRHFSGFINFFLSYDTNGLKICINGTCYNADGIKCNTIVGRNSTTVTEISTIKVQFTTSTNITLRASLYKVKSS